MSKNVFLLTRKGKNQKVEFLSVSVLQKTSALRKTKGHKFNVRQEFQPLLPRVGHFRLRDLMTNKTKFC